MAGCFHNPTITADLSWEVQIYGLPLLYRPRRRGGSASTALASSETRTYLNGLVRRNVQ